MRVLARQVSSLWSSFDYSGAPMAAGIQAGGLFQSSTEIRPLVGAFLTQVHWMATTTAMELKNAGEDTPSMPRLTSTGTMGRRFYKKAHMEPAEDGSGYLVLLDGRVLKTPAKKPLKVASPELALAIAAEWEWQVAASIFFTSYTMFRVWVQSGQHTCGNGIFKE